MILMIHTSFYSFSLSPSPCIIIKSKWLPDNNSANVHSRSSLVMYGHSLTCHHRNQSHGHQHNTRSAAVGSACGHDFESPSPDIDLQLTWQFACASCKFCWPLTAVMKIAVVTQLVSSSSSRGAAGSAEQRYDCRGRGEGESIGSVRSFSVEFMETKHCPALNLNCSP